MSKILITLVIPSVKEEFDVLVPDFLIIKELTALLAEAIADITQNMYTSSGHEVLCRKDPGMILNGGCTLQEYGVKNGEYLYLF